MPKTGTHAAVPHCTCAVAAHAPKLVVLTGGPGAGKTAILEFAQREFCKHVTVLPEAANVLWQGKFPRRDSALARRAAQRAIARVQIELERIALEDTSHAVVLCDRGTLDGVAYWPGPEAEFYAETGIDRAHELARYAAVIHLRTPDAYNGYNHRNPMRTENSTQASVIDERIVAAWDGHPRRMFVDSTPRFLTKLAQTIELIRAEIPMCCQGIAQRMLPA
ncbi:MAG: ATP-binding protein [Kofleriaceae bacterium]|nr:ATP-binding protein [Kofleriaceae bacterium]